jgi:two-component system nitrogen regulation sensor histidine kinase NtrY
MQQKNLRNWLFYWITIPIILFLVFGLFFSNFLIKRSIDAWFRPSVRKAIQESRSVAISYSKEKDESLKSVLLALRLSINKNFKGEYSHLFLRVKLGAFLEDYLKACNLSEIIICNKKQGVVARVAEDETDSKISIFPSWLFSFLDDYPTVVSVGDCILGVIKLTTQGEDLFIIAVKKIDPDLKKRIFETDMAAKAYDKNLLEQASLSNKFMLVFIGVLFIVIFIILVISIKLSNRIVGPITALIESVRRVNLGDYNTDFRLRYGIYEMKILGQMIYEMMQKIRNQRVKLEQSYDKLSNSQILLDQILNSITSCVALVSEDFNIQFSNKSFLKLFADDYLKNDLFDMLKSQYSEAFSFKIKEKTFIVNKIKQKNGWILTLEDIEYLLEKEKQDAFAKIIQKIAHEIKNPLTPIRLSAQAIAIKNPDIKVHTAIILRNTDQINNLISSFSTLANMPKPIMIKRDFGAFILDLVNEFRVSFSEVNFEVFVFEKFISFDEKLIYQAISNVVFNCLDVLKGVKKPKIVFTLIKKDEKMCLKIEDNGPNWPDGDLEVWLNPYKTNKSSPGHGFGLSIAKKIMEEHNGSIELVRGEFGAIVCLVFDSV